MSETSPGKKALAFWQYLAIILILAAIAYSFYLANKKNYPQPDELLKKRHVTIQPSFRDLAL